LHFIFIERCIQYC